MKYQIFSIALVGSLSLAGCPKFEVPEAELPEDLKDKVPADYAGKGAGGSGALDEQDKPNPMGGEGGAGAGGGEAGGGSVVGPGTQLGAQFFELFNELGVALCGCISDENTVCDPTSASIGDEPVTPESAACLESHLLSVLDPEQFQCLLGAFEQQIACIHAAAQEATCDELALAQCELSADTCGFEPSEFMSDAECSGEDSEFECANGGSIPSSWICDGDNDCGDLSDEQNCGELRPDLFTCPSGQSIPSSWICDGDNDCGDLADEQECATVEPFTCPGGEQIPQSWVCDGDNDCGDLSDEQGCAEIELFTCPGGEQIPQSWVCDGDNDCGDLADEQECTASDN